MNDKDCMEIISEGAVTVVAFNTASISNTEAIASASEQIIGFIKGNQPARMVVDFEAVKFFSSQVLGLLLNIRAKLQAYGGEVVISAIEPQLHKVFKITNLDKVFKFFPDREIAVKTISSDSEN